MIALDNPSDRAPRSAHIHGDRGNVPCARIDHIASVLDRADAILDDDPDAAMLLLDGVISQLAHALADGHAHGEAAASPLYALDRRAPGVAYRLRLALRAPSPLARLIHCRQLFQLLS